MIWAPESLQDVHRIYRFLAPKDPWSASRAVSAIREGMQIVAENSGAGRPVDGMDPEFREWPVALGDSGYLVLNRLDGDRAAVLAIRHKREAGYS